MDPSQTVLVVGAGISGVACAQALTARGVPVAVADRGRRIGGRMAVRTRDGRPADIGASYFTVSDPRFGEVVDGWAARGLARPWTDRFAAWSPAEPQLVDSAGPMRWAAPGGLRSLVEDLARGLSIEARTVAGVGPASPAVGPAAPGAGPGLLVDGTAWRAAVLAMPDPQAARLLDPALAADAAALDQTYDPVLALTAAWPTREWADVDGVFVNDDPDLSWIADDGRRRGDGAPVLVAHSTAALAAAHLAEPEAAAPALLAALRRVLGLAAAPAWTSMQRWTFAKPAGTREAAFHLSPAGLGFCGDGWSTRPRVEAAYLSGLELGHALADHLT